MHQQLSNAIHQLPLRHMCCIRCHPVLPLLLLLCWWLALKLLLLLLFLRLLQCHALTERCQVSHMQRGKPVVARPMHLQWLLALPGSFPQQMQLVV